MRSPAWPHPPADLEAVEPRHQHVEHDRVDGLAGDRVERLLAVAGERDVVGVEPQGTLERPPHGGLVVDHEDASPSRNDGACA